MATQQVLRVKLVVRAQCLRIRVSQWPRVGAHGALEFFWSRGREIDQEYAGPFDDPKGAVAVACEFFLELLVRVEFADRASAPQRDPREFAE